MSLFTIPYIWDSGNPAKNTKILDFVCAHPYWVTTPLDEEGRRITWAGVMVNPQNLIREVWDGGELVGMLYLGDITTRVNGVVHWMFLDHKLTGKRQILLDWFGQCFIEQDLQRLTVYCPEFVPTLEHYARRKLGFKYEGEDLARKLSGLERLKKDPHHRPDLDVARLGSRRERSHWYEGQWWDITVLRLLRTEYEALCKEV